MEGEGLLVPFFPPTLFPFRFPQKKDANGGEAPFSFFLFLGDDFTVERCEGWKGRTPMMLLLFLFFFLPGKRKEGGR